MEYDGINLEVLYREHYTEVYQFFFGKLRHKENAEDLAGRTFLKVVEHQHAYDREKSKLRTWVRRISEHVLIDYYRTRRVVLPLDEKEPGSGTDLFVSFEEQYAQIIHPLRSELLAAIRQLPARDRVLVCHKYLLGFSYHEIADKFQINESTLASALLRAKEKLRVNMDTRP